MRTIKSLILWVLWILKSSLLIRIFFKKDLERTPGEMKRKYASDTLKLIIAMTVIGVLFTVAGILVGIRSGWSIKEVAGISSVTLILVGTIIWLSWPESKGKPENNIEKKEV